jgi:DNA gyrase subunit A
MSVIVSRALPDVRDGLKPVHRRILYAMNEGGYTHGQAYRKSARIVGEVMGNYHPHGDQSIYDALVRMAQDFSMGAAAGRRPGQFRLDRRRSAGGHALHRKPRLRRRPMALLDDIDKDTVDFQPNYDGTAGADGSAGALPEPAGQWRGGIAVGMATNIPPHNLSESHRRHGGDDRQSGIGELDELLEIVPGPDFPTGGDPRPRRRAQGLMTGRGSVVMRAKHGHRGPSARTRSARRHRDSLPGEQGQMVEKIAELVREKRIEGHRRPSR